MPGWKKQHLRVAVPIVQPDSVSGLWEWRRVCNATTLGELMIHLGHRYTAKQIYYFYRTLRIIAVKRRKHPRTVGPALAPPLSGMLRSGAQASQIKDALVPQRKRLVAEYLRATGRDGEVPVSECDVQENFDKALRHLFACVLHDMRPPWLNDIVCSGQTSPWLDGLSLYTRLSFLQ